MTMSPADLLLTESGGVFARSELPGTPFADVISGDAPQLVLRAETQEGVCAFAAAAIAEKRAFDGQTVGFFVPTKDVNRASIIELEQILKAASSVVRSVHLRSLPEKGNDEALKVETSDIVSSPADKVSDERFGKPVGTPLEVSLSDSTVVEEIEKERPGPWTPLNLQRTNRSTRIRILWRIRI